MKIKSDVIKKIRHETKRKFHFWAERHSHINMADEDKLYALLQRYGVLKYAGTSYELSCKLYSFGADDLFSEDAIKEPCREIAKEYVNK